MENPKVDFYFNKSSQWQAEFKTLRKIALACGLQEQLKWGNPCYTLNDKNIVLMHGFKEYCALLFFKGAIMADPEKLLIQQTKNVQAARQMRFTSKEEIEELKAIIKAYIFEAIEIEKEGLKVELKETEEFEMPAEFEAILKKNKALKQAFENLTPGRQRAYLLHFSSAKQAKTKIARIEKNIPLIMEGKGIND